MSEKKKQTPKTPSALREDYWLELGPASAYTGTESYETARENGDVSPDGKRFGWPGAEKAPYSPHPGEASRPAYTPGCPGCKATKEEPDDWENVELPPTLPPLSPDGWPGL